LARRLLVQWHIAFRSQFVTIRFAIATPSRLAALGSIVALLALNVFAMDQQLADLDQPAYFAAPMVELA